MKGCSVNKAILVVLALLLPQTALAATVCRLMMGGGVAFGPYDTAATAPTDTALNFQVRCEREGGPENVTLTVSLGTGMHSGTVSARRMLHGGGSGTYLAYGLFRDVSRSAYWGMTPNVDAVSQTLAVPNKGSATATFTIYARIPALQNVFSGSYTDSVQVTLTP